MNGEIAKLWRAVAEAQKAIGEIHRDRIDRAMRTVSAVDAAKMN